MKITAFKNTQLLILSIALSFIFFGYNAAEQHFTSFYQSIGIQNLAFQSLAIIYASIVLGHFIGPSCLRFLGAKLAFFLGYLAYAVLIFGFVTKEASLVYFLSSLLGVGAGISGIARVEFLRFIAPKANRGEFAGAIESVRTFGGFIGIASVSLLLILFGIDQIFILLGTVTLIGVLLLLSIKNFNQTKFTASELGNIKLMIKLAFDPKILLLLPYNAAGGFLLGLVLGTIPAIIEARFGIGWVGLTTSLFHLSLALVSLGAGYLSDTKGRFGLIYSAIVVTIFASLMFLNSSTLLALSLVMVLLGLGNSLANGAFSALLLDTFEEKVKEAVAVLGNGAIILGIVPSFLLPLVLPKDDLIWVAIIFSIIGAAGVYIFQLNYSSTQSSP